jgi:hypothetical protein
MRHRLLCVLSASFATAAVAATPALATDEPVPGPSGSPAAPLQAAPSIPALQGVLGKCSDNSRPSSGFGATAIRSAARNRILRGTARDVGCGVAMVTVSVARQHGKSCRYLTTKRRLSRPTKCGGGHWLVAAGTGRWHIALPKGLPRGTYLVRTRAIDFAGNVQTPRVGRHIQRLRLR